MVLPAFSGCRASWAAAHTAAPEVMPTRMPLSPGQLPARSVGIRIRDREDFIQDAAVQILRHKVGADALKAVGARMALRQQGRGSGLKGHHAHSGFCAFRYRPTPLTVPPVPTPATKMSTFPPCPPRSQGRWSSRVPLDWRGFQTVLR